MEIKLEQIFNREKAEKEFSKEMVNDTKKYQKKYGFQIGENNL